MRVLVGQAKRRLEQKFGAHKTNAVADCGIEACKVFRGGNVEQNRDPPAIGRIGRRKARGLGGGQRCVRSHHALLEQATRLRLRIEDHASCIAIDQCQRRWLPVPRQRAEPDDHRRPARPRQHRDMRGR